MSSNLILISQGKKFVWDGLLYGTSADSERAKEKYVNDGFEVRSVEKEGEFLLYTRRAVKQAAAVP